MSLIEARTQFKPFKHPCPYGVWKRRRPIHQALREVPSGEDFCLCVQPLTNQKRISLLQSERK